MAHARRKFFDLHAANESPMAAEVLRQIQLLYRNGPVVPPVIL
jgi:hypothetical protein